MTPEWWLLLGLFVKHFVCDFPLQALPYQYRNKGTYGHMGGVLHAGIHVAGTMVVFLILLSQIPVSVGRPVVVVLLFMALTDGVIHYHIDWAKMNWCRKMGWGLTNSEKFWVVLGLDQLLHALTYFGIAAIIFR